MSNHCKPTKTTLVSSGLEGGITYPIKYAPIKSRHRRNLGERTRLFIRTTPEMENCFHPQRQILRILGKLKNLDWNFILVMTKIVPLAFLTSQSAFTE